MKLFYSPTSPYARKVRAVLIERGLDAMVELITSSPMANPADLQAANPLGKIPALVLDDGRTVFDSPVICAYLDTLGDAPPLIPSAPAARLDCLMREALADGMMDAAFQTTMERKRPPEQQSPEWLGRWSSAITRSIAVCESAAPRSGAFDYGDIALACALGYVDLRLGDLDWAAKAPRLRAWFTAISQRPSLAATTPP